MTASRPSVCGTQGLLGGGAALYSDLDRREVKPVELRGAFDAVVWFLRRNQRGQGLAEYALILALIAIVSIVALIFMGSQVSDKLSVIGSQLKSVSG